MKVLRKSYSKIGRSPEPIVGESRVNSSLLEAAKQEANSKKSFIEIDPLTKGEISNIFKEKISHLRVSRYKTLKPTSSFLSQTRDQYYHSRSEFSPPIGTYNPSYKLQESHKLVPKYRKQYRKLREREKSPEFYDIPAKKQASCGIAFSKQLDRPELKSSQSSFLLAPKTNFYHKIRVPDMNKYLRRKHLPSLPVYSTAEYEPNKEVVMPKLTYCLDYRKVTGRFSIEIPSYQYKKRQTYQIKDMKFLE